MPATVNADSLRAALEERAAAAVDAGTDATKAKMADLAPGTLGQAIEVKADDSAKVLRRLLIVDREHASYQDTGTGIYGPRHAPIFPRKPGGVMVFEGRDGTTVFARFTLGVQPTMFFSTPFEEYWDEVQRAWDAG